MSDELPEPTGALLERVARVLADHGVADFAFTGGIAVGVWAAPRHTHDVDVCGVLPLHEVDRLLLLRDGIRSGSEELPDIVRFRVGAWDVDLFVSKGEYDAECLRRAVRTTVDGVEARVVTAEDLLLHKMLKLRHDRRRVLQDLADVRAVVSARGSALDWGYIAEWARAEEAELLRSVAASDDDEVLRRVFRSS